MLTLFTPRQIPGREFSEYWKRETTISFWPHVLWYQRRVHGAKKKLWFLFSSILKTLYQVFDEVQIVSTYIQVQTTVANETDALAIARHVVEKRLAGCVQISQCTSLYRWQDAISQDKEYLCTMKTHNTLFNRLEEAVKQIHPYEEPEIIATPIIQGSATYLKWLAGVLQDVDVNQYMVLFERRKSRARQ
eukprot:TRINITY_DN30940_c0_g1_i1.p2 TRINITY_DN30940_c0_g1~~TRINITY_DN30940_c0_g1_i1.p2  ORF type:complete len:190 (-),score=7.69 TRINITY_DN30940_c0_g1_i1:268-837(-)